MDGSKWAIAAAGIVVPVAAVLLALPLQHGFWLLLALAGGVAVSVTFVELGARDGSTPEAAPLDSGPPQAGDRLPGDESSVVFLHVYAKRVGRQPGRRAPARALAMTGKVEVTTAR